MLPCVWDGGSGKDNKTEPQIVLVAEDGGLSLDVGNLGQSGILPGQPILGFRMSVWIMDYIWLVMLAELLVAVWSPWLVRPVLFSTFSDPRLLHSGECVWILYNIILR